MKLEYYISLYILVEVKFSFHYRHLPFNWHPTMTCIVQLYYIPVYAMSLITR